MERKVVSYKEIIQMLPGSWQELTIGQYEKIADIKPTQSNNEIDKLHDAQLDIVKIISRLTNVDQEELLSIPMYQFYQMAQKINFISTFPEDPMESNIELKKAEELTYDEFLTYLKYSNAPLLNLSILIHAFQKKKKNKQSIDEIKKLSMLDGLSAFFLSVNELKKSLKQTRTSLTRRLMKQLIMEKLIGLVRRGRKKN